MDTASEIEQLRLVAEISGLKPAQVALPQAGDLVVEGFRLHYLDWGAGARGPILFRPWRRAERAYPWDAVCVRCCAWTLPLRGA